MLGKCPKCSEVIDTAKVTPVAVSHDPVHHQTGKQLDIQKDTNPVKGEVQVTEKHLSYIAGKTAEEKK